MKKPEVISCFEQVLSGLRRPRVGLYLLASLFHWRPRCRKITRALAPFVAMNRDKGKLRIIDVGCGPGKLCPVAIELGFNYLGVEPDEAALAYCRAIYHRPDANFTSGSAVALPVAIGGDDIVVLNGVLHHLNDSETARLLDQATTARALIVADHLCETPRYSTLVQLLQSLDRGRFVRHHKFFDTLQGYRTVSNQDYSIRVLGITCWRYFTHVYHPWQSV